MAIILVDCYVENWREKIKNYSDLFGIYGEIKVVQDTHFANDSEATVYVITGSQKYVSKNEFKENLLKYMRETEIPIIGICYGHHLIAKAHGADVKMGEKLIKKDYHKNPEFIKVLKNDEIFNGLPEYFAADEFHKDYIVETEEFRENFEILASSESCQVEVIKHKKKLIYGFQFHIERSGNAGEIIAKNFFRLIKNVR